MSDTIDTADAGAKTVDTGAKAKGYVSGKYWRDRSDLLYYQYFRFFVRCLAPQAQSLCDVGTANSPYLEWFDWIPERVSVDLTSPYSSPNVKGIVGNIFDLSFDKRFDLCSCMQVLEHVPDPEPFAHRLLELGQLLLVSVPYKWPKGSVRTHVNDPVDLGDVTRWFGRAPNYNLIVREPFGGRKSARLFAIYDPFDEKRVFKSDIRKKARPL